MQTRFSHLLVLRVRCDISKSGGAIVTVTDRRDEHFILCSGRWLFKIPLVHGHNLPPQTTAASSLLTFRRQTKSHLFRQSIG